MKKKEKIKSHRSFSAPCRFLKMPCIFFLNRECPVSEGPDIPSSAGAAMRPAIALKIQNGLMEIMYEMQPNMKSASKQPAGGRAGIQRARSRREQFLGRVSAAVG